MEILIVCLIIMALAYKLGQQSPIQNNQSFKFKFKQEELDSFNLGSNDWPAILTVMSQEKKYKINSYPSDRLSDFNTVYEYQIIEKEIENRLIEETSEHAGEKLIYTVKNNIFLEKDFDNHNKDSFLKTSLVDEKKQKQKDIFWHKLENNFIRFFIFAHHPEVITREQLKNEIVEKLRTLSSGISCVRQDIESLGGEFSLWPSGNPTGYAANSLDQNSYDKLNRYFENEEFKRHHITKNEISHYNDIKNKYMELYELLS